MSRKNSIFVDGEKVLAQDGVRFKIGNGVNIEVDDLDIKISADPLAYYPVNSVYFSTSNTNPSTYFGGTWNEEESGNLLIGLGTINVYAFKRTA